MTYLCLRGGDLRVQLRHFEGDDLTSPYSVAYIYVNAADVAGNFCMQFNFLIRLDSSATVRVLARLPSVIWFYIQITDQPGSEHRSSYAEQIAGEADTNAQQDEVNQIEFESLE
jgi:hypothetical protein